MYYSPADRAPVEPMLCVVCDASWKITSNNRGLIGYAMFIGWENSWSLIEHSCGLTKSTGLSSTQTETAAMCTASCRSLGKANLMRQEGYRCKPWIGGDNRTVLLNAETGNNKKLSYMPPQVEHIFDAVTDGLHHVPEYVMTRANTADLLSKRMKVSSDFNFKLGQVYLFKMDDSFKKRFIPLEAEELNVKVTDKDIYPHLAKFNLKWPEFDRMGNKIYAGEKI